MADIEKVTKGLQYCTKTDGNQCPKCPYFNGECTEELSKDALELLKEQGPIAPKQASTLFGSTLRWWYVCGNCGLEIRDGENKWQYCPRCGRPVKWDSSCS